MNYIKSIIKSVLISFNSKPINKLNTIGIKNTKKFSLNIKLTIIGRINSKEKPTNTLLKYL